MSMSRTLPVSLMAVGVVVFAAAASGPATAVGAPTDTRTSITVDCALGEGEGDNQVILPGEALTVTLLNCDQWLIEDRDGPVNDTLEDPSGAQNDSWVVDGTPVVFEVNGNSDIELEEPVDGEEYVDIDVYVATEAATPSGTLNLTTRLTMPVVIPDFEIDVPLMETSASPAASVGTTMNTDEKLTTGVAPAASLDDLAACQLEDGYHPYQSLPISISTAGEFTFRVIDVTPVDEDLQWGQPYLPSQDFFLAVYTQFDPENPEANLVNCSDDREENRVFVVNGGVTYISDDQTPEFVAALEPGGYTLVLSVYRSTSSDEWAVGEFSPWSGVSEITWDPQPMTALFELWGPAGSIASGNQSPELAETGAPLDLTMGIAGFGLLTALAGATLLLSRRRIARV